MLVKTRLNKKNLLLALNTWAISVIRYSAAFLDWTKEATKELERWTRKQLIAGRALHPKLNEMRIFICMTRSDQSGRILCSRITKHRFLS